LFEPLTLKEKAAYKRTVEKDILSKKPEEDFSSPPEVLREYAPEAKFQVLTFEKEVLLVAGLLLARAPRIARSEKFARQIREYKIEKELPPAKIFKQAETVPPPVLKPEISEKEIEKKSTFRKEKTSRKDFSAPEIKDETSPEKKPKIVFQDLKTVERETEESSKIYPEIKSEKRTEKTGKPKEIRVEKSKTEIVFEKQDPKRETKIYQAKDEKFRSIPSTDEIEESETEEFETIVRTKFGGVFYLLNLGLFLKLYRDFSEPLGDEIELNIWDFVALLSRKFLGKKIEKDEVWGLLKQLAGHEKGEIFGEDFDPPDEWRVPADWLKTFQTEKKKSILKIYRRVKDF
jgi:hypothetical protein